MGSCDWEGTVCTDVGVFVLEKTDGALELGKNVGLLELGKAVGKLELGTGVGKPVGRLVGGVNDPPLLVPIKPKIAPTLHNVPNILINNSFKSY